MDYAYAPEWRVNDKAAGAEFVARLGVKTPARYAVGISLDRITATTGVVIKPTSGHSSKGVFIVAAADRIYQIETGTCWASWEEFQAAARKRMVETGAPDEWIVEELILERPGDVSSIRDLKFFCFYGRCMLVSESCRWPEKRFCWWDMNGEPIVAGPRQEIPYVGKGFTQEYVELAERISLQIPAPFIRVDFLTGSDGPVFGEFTPRPGRYEQFVPEWDRRLGEAFLDAEGRLGVHLRQVAGPEWS